MGALAFLVCLACLYSVIATKNVNHMGRGKENEHNAFNQFEQPVFGSNNITRRDQHFAWGNCRSSDPVKITSMTLSPDPLTDKDPVRISLEMVVSEKLVDNIQAKLIIQMFDDETNMWRDMCPFLHGQGFFRCEFSNICILLETTEKCPKVLTDTQFKCKCPIEASTYVIRNYTFPHIPDIPITGMFNVTMNLAMNGRPIACGYIKFRYEYS